MSIETNNPNINKTAGQTLPEIAASIKEGAYDGVFKLLYPQSDNADCRARYLGLIDLFKECYMGDGAANQTPDFNVINQTTDNIEDNRKAVIISAPGRTEICGNHTDHQHGNVLAAAIDLDIICVAVANNSNIIRVKSVGHSGISIDIGDTSPREGERGEAASLIRGLAAWFIEHGVKVGGFDSYTTSQVLVGSGLSSSAAFEVVVGAAINTLFSGNISPQNIAIAGQYAENRYFGKPSGLMDQTASSVGGFVKIDFCDPKNPVVEPIQYDLSSNGLRLCVVNTKGTHANLIGEYASIPGEMRAVASFFGKHYLRDVDEDQFYQRLAEIREALRDIKASDGSASGSGDADADVGTNGETPVAADRAILRAIHFFRENRLVTEAADALRAADIEKFMDCLIRSGQSSFTYLQNIFAVTEPGEQGLSIALALSESILRGKGGAWRVTGGGFAGTIMALVPESLHEKYISTLEAAFGEGSCITLSIRRFGGIEITTELMNANGR